MNLRQDANYIISESIKSMLPDSAVKSALKHFNMPKGNVYLLAIGKAAWQMAKTALEEIPEITSGIIITKTGHSNGKLNKTDCYEASHPVTDEAGISAARKAIEMVRSLKKEDKLIFLLSGGASALFEDPLIPFSEYQSINEQLLQCGADIHEINTIRKRISNVKGGKLAKMCKAKIFNIFLSDIIDNQIDMIGSGPTCPDTSTCQQALDIVNKYDLHFSDEVLKLLNQETVKQLDNIETHVSGSVTELCNVASEICKKLGYQAEIVTTQLTGEASEVGKMIGKRIKETKVTSPVALIYGGETTVTVRGNGKGGRNQELVLSAIPYLEETNALLFSVGSDGTDGPTDAAGGMVDSNSISKLKEKNIIIDDVLCNNDSYSALKAIDALVFTGPTGTNVNDLTVALINLTE